MKFNFLIKASLSFILIFFCSFYSNKSNYQTECVSLDTDGYFIIKIWDVKKGARYKSEDARKDAIHSMLFSGIAGTNGCITQQPILVTFDDQENFKKIEKEFFAKNGKWNFYTRGSAMETTLPLFLGPKDWKVYQVSVSKTALRRYLEELKIIKSLNTQF